FLEGFAECIAVIGFVAQKLPDAGDHSDALRPDRAVGGVAGRENDHPGTAQFIDQRVKLAVAAPPGDADRLFRGPSFAAAGAAVGFGMRAVQRHVLGRLRRPGRRLEYVLPNSAPAPTVEAIVD